MENSLLLYGAYFSTGLVIDLGLIGEFMSSTLSARPSLDQYQFVFGGNVVAVGILWTAMEVLAEPIGQYLNVHGETDLLAFWVVGTLLVGLAAGGVKLIVYNYTCGWKMRQIDNSLILILNGFLPLVCLMVREFMDAASVG